MDAMLHQLRKTRLCLVVAAGFLVAWSGTVTAQRLIHEWRGVLQTPITDGFGQALAGLRDVDGDGVPDVGIGAPNTIIGGNLFVGRAYVFSGKTKGQVFVISGSQAGQYVGGTVCGPGDIDGDGQADFIIGDNTLPYLSLYSGRNGTFLRTFGSYASVAGPGDIDQDRVSDLLLGNSVAMPGGLQNAGEAALVSGRTGLVVYYYPGTYANQGLGFVGAAGDVDTDGVLDLLVGAYGNWPWTGRGGVWAYSGATGNLMFYLAPPPGSDSFPWRLIGVGDVNADGFDDVAVHDRGPRLLTPYFHIDVFAGPTGAKLFTLQSPSANPTIGDSLAAPGDVDGDGHDDILTSGAGVPGQVFVFSGRDQSVLITLTGRLGQDRLGNSSSGVGDLDGDDFPDLLVGGYDEQAKVSFVRLYSGAPDGVSAFGLGCPDGRGVVPRIGASYRPELGGAFALNLSRVPPSVPATLILGASNRTWAGFGLPLDLAPFGLAGCSLLVSADLLVPVQTLGTAGKGWASMPLSIPNAPALVGAGFFAQWLVLGGGQAPPSLSRGLEVTVQPNT